jgi:2-polyprenyl-3-methyl-5-hydroxy-6-metoxy-1,4-benzoquinol methylase
MKRYSKPLGKLLDFKQEFLKSNDSKLEEFINIASVYRSQPQRLLCKNCEHKLDYSPSECFKKLGIEYCFCSRCGHCNGKYEDTDNFCRSLYTADYGVNYAKDYSASDIQEYKNRVMEIYIPKAEFLKVALEELGENRSIRLADFGAGAGYFVSAAMECGFIDVTGYEPSETLVNLGNAMIGSSQLFGHDITETVALIEKSNVRVTSFIGVLEHLQKPREILKALRQNDNIKYVFFSVPLFSPTVVIESVFKDVMPRHLVAGHTHLYTDNSIQYFCDEFGFQRQSEWWFGLDICDLFRSVLVSLQKSSTKNFPLQNYWSEYFMPLVDNLQSILDRAQACSEVHMLLKKK